jgi:dTMP kinase
MFIAIDGPNGVGKTSVSHLLAETLRRRGLAAAVLAQPSKGAAGLMARQEALTGWPLAALVVADRYVQIQTEIKPALAAGITVVLDRYVASTLVLQRMDGLDPAVLWEMNARALRPDMAVLLQARPDTLRERLRQRVDLSRFERMTDGAETETRLYAEAADRMERGGYRTLPIDTTEIPVGAVVERILDALNVPAAQ